MALILQQKKLNAVRYISKRDSAIDKEASDFDEYYEDIVKNADKLKMKQGQEPTIFLLNLEINGKEDAAIKDSQLARIDDDKNPVMAMGKWAYTVCRIILKDVINPPGTVGGIEFKKDGRGYVSDKTMDTLAKYGLVDEIWQQYLSLTGDKNEEKVEAKN